MRATPEGVTLRVRVRPRSARDEVRGVQAGALVVRLTAPPVEGEANAALIRVLARALRLAPSAVELMRGQTGRDKLLRVRGLAAEFVRARLVPREDSTR